ncbi:phosphatase [Bryobacterales bacterium F-183]|nr:phosphatase [Bryobacterales bacterium F-183]
MAYNFGSLVFTPVVKALQEKYGSRRQYARMENSGAQRGDRLGPQETDYIAEQDSFYISTIGSTGWPYVQHRGGPKGFLKVIDDHTVAFADFSGNRQYVSTGNLMTDNRAALILVDYPRQARLKILGRVEVFEGDKAKDWLPKLTDPTYKAHVERAYVITVEALDWNCPQHIVRRYTEEQIRHVLEPIERRLQDLEAENAELRRKLADHQK